MERSRELACHETSACKTISNRDSKMPTWSFGDPERKWRSASGHGNIGIAEKAIC